MLVEAGADERVVRPIHLSWFFRNWKQSLNAGRLFSQYSILSYLGFVHSSIHSFCPHVYLYPRSILRRTNCFKHDTGRYDTPNWYASARESVFCFLAYVPLPFLHLSFTPVERHLLYNSMVAVITTNPNDVGMPVAATQRGCSSDQASVAAGTQQKEHRKCRWWVGRWNVEIITRQMWDTIELSWRRVDFDSQDDTVLNSLLGAIVSDPVSQIALCLVAHIFGHPFPSAHHKRETLLRRKRCAG